MIRPLFLHFRFFTQAVHTSWRLMVIVVFHRRSLRASRLPSIFVTTMHTAIQKA